MNKISVIVPIYKVEQYLDKCVQSIIDQTYTNLEIILVDDGSPDNCGAMCEDWAKKDSRIKAVHKENGGLSDARNAGLAVATGEFISFIDSDDYIEPTFLQSLYSALYENNADVAECKTVLVDESGAVLRSRGCDENIVFEKFEALKRLICENGVYQTVWNKLYKRSVIEGILFEKGKCNEDDFWTWQVFERAASVAVINEPLYNYVQRGQSIMSVGYNKKRLDGLYARFLRMKELQKYQELATLTRQNLVLDCLWHLQSVLRCLEGEERQKATEFVLKIIKDTPKVPQNKLELNLKQRIWYTMTKTFPIAIAKLRNRLGIGV